MRIILRFFAVGQYKYEYLMQLPLFFIRRKFVAKSVRIPQKFVVKNIENNVDVGLLGCMVGLHPRTLLDGNDLFVEFKGALTEQYVCEQLRTIEDLGIYYYTNDRGACEIDFVVDTGERIIPVEVKAEVNLRAKSLRVYHDKFMPDISVRTSMSDFKKEEWLVNLPLYAIEEIKSL